jgi:hypothetical protein
MILNSKSTTFNNFDKNYTFLVPLHCKILDVFIDDYNQLYLSYSTEESYVDARDKEISVYVTQAYTPNENLSNNFKFLRSCDVIKVDINNTTIGNTISINQKLTKMTYLIFTDENRQTAEVREDNLNKIL